MDDVKSLSDLLNTSGQHGHCRFLTIRLVRQWKPQATPANGDSGREESPGSNAEESVCPSNQAIQESWSRSEQLKQGELIDVSSYAAAVGFVVPVALSRDAWFALVDIKEDQALTIQNPRMKERRLLDILLQALRAARDSGNSLAARFNMYRLTSKAERKIFGKVAIKNDLLVCCGPGDNAEPVVTIYLLNPPKQDVPQKTSDFVDR